MAAKTTDLSPEAFAEAARQFTSMDTDVYFATGDADRLDLAVAMARLSRSPDDLRFIVANEFTGNQGKAEAVTENILFNYGDDSVAQLVTLQAVVEGGSNLLTKILEWGRLASYLEQSTRYMVFDQKDLEGKYPFYTPEDLSPGDATYYDSQMALIFDAYSEAASGMTDYLHQIMEKDPELGPKQWASTLKAQACDMARMLLPAAVKSTVAIEGSAQAFENMITRMLSLSLPEARMIGDQLLYHARLVAPQYFRRVDLADRGSMTSMYLANTRTRVKEWVNELGLSESDNVVGEKVQLVDYTPKDELEIVKYVLFDASGMSIDQIDKVLSGMSDTERRSILLDYIGDRQHNRRHKPGRAFEHPHYSWELMTDYGLFRDLQRHRMVDDLRWQQLTAGHGHVEIPELAIQAGVAGQFKKAFEISEALTQFIKSRYGADTAQYATLLGHLMRWTMTENAREAYHIHELRTSSQGHPGYRRVVNQMHEEVKKVHPIIAEGMVHVDTSENPKLARLKEALNNARRARMTGQQ